MGLPYASPEIDANSARIMGGPFSESVTLTQSDNASDDLSAREVCRGLLPTTSGTVVFVLLDSTEITYTVTANDIVSHFAFKRIADTGTTLTNAQMIGLR